MMAIAILAILLTLAIPSFREMILSSKLKSYSANMVSSVYLARGEALKRNMTINLCVSADGQQCTEGNWQDGWIVLAGDKVILRQQPISQGYNITESSGLTNLRFQSSGLAASPAAFIICRAAPTAGSHERAVTIAITGRPYTSRTANGVCP